MHAGKRGGLLIVKLVWSIAILTGKVNRLTIGLWRTDLVRFCGIFDNYEYSIY